MSNLSNLYLLEGENCFSLPKWANFYIEVGKEIAQFSDYGKRIVVATAIPIRSYTAVFTGLGIILNRGDILIDTQEHFEYLCNLPIETPLNIYENNIRIKGKYKGFVHENGNEYLKIQVEAKTSGKLTKYIPRKIANQVSLGNSNKKLPKRQKGYKIKENNSFIKNLFPPDKVNQLLINSQLDCALVGNKKILQSEINNTWLYKNNSSGTFQDILRVRSLLSPNKPYRSEIFSEQTEPNLSGYNNLFVTIFDGSSGFIKWRNYFRDSHWIIFLDRTENTFQEAVDIINENYMNRIGEPKIENLLSIPIGVEIMKYEERNR
ncbi:MAG: hypothetical protein ACOCRO_08675 [Halanaerobiales bacterium]